MSVIKSPRIAIIGAGVSGLTTGIVFASVGADVIIYADRFPAQEEKKNVYSSLSNYAKGAIIPRNISQADSLMRFFESVSFFRKLSLLDWPIRQKRHLEMFDKNYAPPEYLQLMDYLKEPENLPVNENSILKHEDLNSWIYSYYLVNPPVYLSHLEKQFKSLGGTKKEANLNRNDLEHLDADYVINCSGIHGYRFEHNAKMPGLLGEFHIEILTDQTEHLPYSFTYRKANKLPDKHYREIFAFPQPGKIITGTYHSDVTISTLSENSLPEVNDNSVLINNFDIPEEFIKEILESIKTGWGVDFSNAPQNVHIGYFTSHSEKQKLYWDSYKPRILHNYGQGDMGFALSWGNAMDCLRMINQQKPLYPDRFSPMEQILSELSQLSVSELK